MPQTLELRDQLALMANSLTRGDIDLLARAMSDPGLLSPEDNQTAAESLGLGGGFTGWAVNVASDPLVWIAALLARRVPSYIPWAKGVPKRYVGMGLEYGPLSMVFKPVKEVFRGTGIDKMSALDLQRTAHFTRLGSRVGQLIEGATDQELVAMVRLTEEGVTAGVTPKIRQLSDEWASYLEQTWSLMGQASDDIQGSIIGAPGARNTVSWGPRRARNSAGQLIETPPAPREFRNMIPHIPILSKQGSIEVSGTEALTRMHAAGGKRLEQALAKDGLKIEFATLNMEGGGTRKVVTRLGPWKVDQATDRISSSLAGFEAAMGGEFGNAYFNHLKPRRRDIALFSEAAEGLFITDIRQIFAHYSRGGARTYALKVPLTQHEMDVGSFLVENPNPKIRIGRFFADRFIPQSLGPEPLAIQIQRAGIKSMGGVVEEGVVAGTENWSRPVRKMTAVMPDVPNKISALQHLTKSLDGHFDESEQLFGNAFAQIATGAETMLKRAHPRLAKRLATNFEYLKSKSTNRALTNYLTTWGYYTTLGANPGPILGNMLQTPLTTLNILGLGPTMAGAMDVARRLPVYAQNVVTEIRRSGGGIRKMPDAGRRAWTTTFPELAEFGVNIDPRLFDLDESTMAATLSGRVGDAFKTTDDYLRWLMVPFSAVENVNRAIAFFGSKRQFMRTWNIHPKLTGLPESLIRNGKITDDAGRLLPDVEEFVNLHSALTVDSTQFLAGGGSRTILQNKMAPWLRSFSTFPMRFMSFAGESTVRGAMVEKELALAGVFDKMLGGRDVSTLARIALSGLILRSGMRDVLGVDVNKWVGFGAIDVGGNLAGPIPIFPIPPIAGALIASGKALVNREFDRTQALELPGVGRIPIPKTLVPAGVAFSRLARAVNQWQPDIGGFVDDDQRLMRRSGADDFIMAALGIPTTKARRERIQLAQLRTRIGKVREFRRKFAMAILQGDLKEANQLSKKYQKMFPGQGPLNVAESDLRTYEENARTPRLARALRSLGKEQRVNLQAEILSIAPEMIAPAPRPGDPESSPLAQALAQLRK